MTGEAFLVPFLLLAVVLFAVVVPLWTYSDARRNSRQSPYLWAIVAFFGSVPGMLLYLVVGRTGKRRRSRHGRRY